MTGSSPWTCSTTSDALVRRSLVVADDDAPETRYRLLETIRQYAHERLEEAGEADTVQRRHAEYYAGLAEEAGEHLRAAEQLDWIARLTPETDNLRTALEWAVDHDRLDLGLRVVVPLCINGIEIAHTALDWAETLAANPAVDEHPLGPAVLAQAAWSAAMRLDDEAAQAFDSRGRAAERALGVPPNPANFQAHAFIASAHGHLDEATAYAQAWIDAAHARDDRYELSQGLAMLGAVVNMTGDNQAAIALLEQSETEARRVANPANLCWTLSTYGMMLSTANPERAVPILREAIDVGTTVGNQQGVGLALTILGSLEHHLGNHRAALVTYLQANEQLLAAGFSGGGLIPHLHLVAREFIAIGEPEAAAICLGAADQRTPSGTTGPQATLNRDETVRMITEALGEQRLTELHTRGATMSDGEVIDYSRTQIERILAT